MKPRHLSVPGRLLLTVLFGGALVFFLYPLWIGIVGSVKTTQQVIFTRVYLPAFPLQFDSFIQAFSILRNPLRISLILGIYVTVIAVMLGVLGGYTLGICRFRGRKLLFSLCLFGIYIPPVTKMLPALKISQWLGVYNTPFGVGLITGAMVMTTATIIFRQFYTQIPKEYVEALTVEGGNHLHIMRYLIIPMSVGAAVSVCVMAFTIGWNNYMMALVLTHGPLENRPVALSVAVLKDISMYEANYSVMLAGGLIAALPPILLYIIFQKQVRVGSIRKSGGLDK
jgi:glucose/mannose transport system permease protein